MAKKKRMSQQRIERLLRNSVLKKKAKKLEFVIYGRIYEVKIKPTILK